MNQQEKYIFDLINKQKHPIYDVNSILDDKQKANPSSLKDAVADIHAYLGLKGGLFGGKYFIDPQLPIGREVPMKLNYQRPMMGGEFKSSMELMPKYNLFMINYKKEF